MSLQASVFARVFGCPKCDNPFKHCGLPEWIKLQLSVMSRVFGCGDCCCVDPLRCLGAFGVASITRARGLYQFAVLAMSTALVLAMVGAYGVLDRSEAVKTANWAYSEVKNVKIGNVDFTTSREGPDFKTYIGLNAIVYSVDSNEYTVDWEDFVCPIPDRCVPMYECQGANPEIAKFVQANVALTLIALLVMFRRVKTENDSDCVKMVSLFFMIAAIVSGAVSVGLFREDCYSDLAELRSFTALQVQPNKPPLTITGEVTYEMGSGFLCVICALALQVFSTIVGLLQPVPDVGSQYDAILKVSFDEV